MLNWKNQLTWCERSASQRHVIAAEPSVLCVRNLTRGTILCARATVARSFRERRRGLLGRRQLGVDEGMIFEAEPFIPLMWMHTLSMAFPIDIVFLGRGHIVVKTQTSLKPWRFSAMVLGASKALELAAGSVIRTKTGVGDRISIARI